MADIGAADSLTHLAQQDLGHIGHHLGLVLIQIVAGGNLQRVVLNAVLIDVTLGSNLDVGDGADVDEQGVSCGDALLRLELHLNDAEVQPVTAHDEGHDECRLADDEPSASGSCDDQYAVGGRYGVAGTGNDDNDDNGNDNGNRHSENIS